MKGWFPGNAGPRTPDDAVRELESYATYLEDLARSERDQVPGLDDRLRSVARRLETLAQTGARLA